MGALKKYVWVFEFSAAAILLAFSIVSVIKEEFLVIVLGLIFIIFGLFRVIPLIKTTESKLIKWLIFVEILINIVVGAGMIFFAKELQEKGKIFGYLVGGILYLRGFMHMLSTSVKNEPTTFISFIVNICFITLGTIIIVKGGFSTTYMAIFFLILSIISAGVLCFKGYKDYRNYRGEIVGKHITKRAKKKKEVETNPTSDQINIPVDEEEDKPVIKA